MGQTTESAMCGVWRLARTDAAQTCRSAKPRTCGTATGHRLPLHLPLPDRTPSVALYLCRRARGAQRASMALRQDTGWRQQRALTPATGSSMRKGADGGESFIVLVFAVLLVTLPCAQLE